jgi:serine/threonine protein kinase/tetratricopeptide (TPR) repeat protein
VAQEDIGSKTLMKGTCMHCNQEFFGVSICPNDGQPIQMTKEDPLVGNILADRFEVLAKLGEGGMSAVYKARHMLMDRIVAIKLLFASDIQSLKRFQLEAKLACNLNHINIVSVFDFGVSNKGQPYLVMDYLEGRSLGDCVKVDGPMHLDRALGIFTQACDALTYAHKRDVIHRDLKPSNFMLVLDDNYSELLKVVDFGIAKQMSFEDAAGQGLTKTGEVFGSPLYMAPEQCLGRRLDARADIYSMGCVMYEVLTGTPPLVGVNALDTLHKHINEDPLPFAITNPRCANLPPMLERLVFKALARDVDQRYQSMLELWTDLEVLRHAAKSSSGRQGPVPVPQVSPSPPSVSPQMINTIPQGMIPPVMASESLRPTMPPVNRDDPNAAAPPFYGQSQTRPPGLTGALPQQMPQQAPQRGAVNPGQGQSDAVRGHAMPQPYLQNATGPQVSHGVPVPPQDATVISSKMQAIQAQAPASGTVNSQSHTDQLSQRGNPTPGMSNSRIAGMGGTQSKQPQNPPSQFSGSGRGATGGAQSRSGDASRSNMLRAKATRQLPIVPIAVTAVAVLAVGGVGAYFLLNHQSSKPDMSSFGHTAAHPQTAPPSVPPAAGGGNWQEPMAAGAKLLEDANYKAAFSKLSEAKDKAHGHPLDAEYAQLLALFGQAASKTDHFQEAIDALTQAQSIFRKYSTPQDELATAACKNCLGLVYINQMDYDNAKAFINEAKSLRDKYGKPDDKADSNQALARMYNRFQSRAGAFGTDQSIKLLQDALTQRGTDPAFDVECTNDMGFTYLNKGELKQARYYYNQAFAKAKANFGAQHPLYADAEVGLGILDTNDGNIVKAKQEFNDALKTRQEAYGENTIKVSEVYACLGNIAYLENNYEQAKTCYENALAIKKDLLGANNIEFKRNDATYHQRLNALAAKRGKQ